MEEQRKVEKQDATIARLEQQIAELTAAVQKVSAQLELNQHLLQTVVDNRCAARFIWVSGEH